jgi:hypothetical protein
MHVDHDKHDHDGQNQNGRSRGCKCPSTSHGGYLRKDPVYKLFFRCSRYPWRCTTRASSTLLLLARMGAGMMVTSL